MPNLYFTGPLFRSLLRLRAVTHIEDSKPLNLANSSRIGIIRDSDMLIALTGRILQPGTRMTFCGWPPTVLEVATREKGPSEAVTVDRRSHKLCPARRNWHERGSPEMNDLFAVTVPVADLRREPVDRAPGGGHDDLQETQLLYNETMLVKEERGGWCRVEALEQRKFTRNNRWENYPGWVRRQCLAPLAVQRDHDFVVQVLRAQVREAPGLETPPLVEVFLGTRLAAPSSSPPIHPFTHPPVHPSSHSPICWIPVGMVDGGQGWMEEQSLRSLTTGEDGEAVRQRIVATARLFLRIPYLWGGRSPDGVDCSGLTNLSFRASGIAIPRDAHEQWMASRKIPPSALLPGDLIFLSGEGRPDAVTHVMLAAGGECFIEASETGTLVRETTFEAKLGLSLAALAKKRFKTGGRRVFFGRILP